MSSAWSNGPPMGARRPKMVEIINLRRARKARGKAEKEKTAEEKSRYQCGKTGFKNPFTK